MVVVHRNVGAAVRVRASDIAGNKTTTGVRGMTIQGDLTQQEQKSDGVVLTDAAAAKVKALLDQEGRDDLRLRLAVQPGGCSGLRYQLFFDERELDGDSVRTYGGVDVIVDR